MPRNPFAESNRSKIRLLAVLLFIALRLSAHGQLIFTTNNGEITITGFAGSGTQVVIPSTTNGLPVTSIGAGAFQNNTNISSVTIPDGVANVGPNAFENCSSLTGISFPDSVTNIGAVVCAGCSSLTDFSIGSGAVTIGLAAEGDGKLSMGQGIVDGCSQLSAFTVDASNPNFESVDGVLLAFNGELLVRCPQGKSGSYTIPDTVTNTSGWAFSGCSELTDIIAGGGLQGMGYLAFNNCGNVTNVTISSGLTNNAGAIDFVDLQGLKTITVESSNPAYVSLNGVLYDLNVTTLIAYPHAKTDTSYTIPSGVTAILGGGFQGGAFNTCPYLTAITIPASLTNIGANAFTACYNLRAVYFQGPAPAGSSMGLGPLYYEFGVLNVYYLPGMPGWTSFIDPGNDNPGAPTTPWFLPYPLILSNNGPGLGIQSNQFGFTVSWATNRSVAVDASTNLAGSFWQPLTTNAITNGSFYFGDTNWTSYPNRFYRIRSL